MVETATRLQASSRWAFVCTGADLQTLFPDVSESIGLRYCKLQMMCTEPQSIELPTNLASGLSIRRYQSFVICPAWQELSEQPINEGFSKYDIHVLLTMGSAGGVVIGDSHEYSYQPMTDELSGQIEELILSEAKRLVDLPSWRIARRWHGVYTQHPEKSLFTHSIDDRIHLITGFGGKGMTTSPALAREWIERLMLL